MSGASMHVDLKTKNLIGHLANFTKLVSYISDKTDIFNSWMIIIIKKEIMAMII